MPHSNSVCFGCEFYEAGDDYPLLYTNIYNNYAQNEDRMLGVCCVYRIRHDGDGLASELVQLIEIGFYEDPALWKASEEGHGVRPFGNFVIDREKRALYAYVMRNEELGSRYFRFDLPRARDGGIDPRFGVRRVVLGKDDIRERFDGGYHRYMQGAILHRGILYTAEGFRGDPINRPAIRILDLSDKRETYLDLLALGMKEEPECIDFYGDACLYSDAPGNLYRIDMGE